MSGYVEELDMEQECEEGEESRTNSEVLGLRWMGKSCNSLNSRELFQGLNGIGKAYGMVNEFIKYALCSLGVFGLKV